MKYIVQPNHVHYDPVLGYFVAEDREHDIEELRKSLLIEDSLDNPENTDTAQTFLEKQTENSITESISINPNEDTDKLITDEQKELAVKIILERLKLVQSLTKLNNVCKSHVYDSNSKDNQIKNVTQLQDKEKIYNEVMKAETIKQKALDIVNKSLKVGVLVTEEINKELNEDIEAKIFRELFCKQRVYTRASERKAYMLGRKVIPTVKERIKHNQRLFFNFLHYFLKFSVSVTKNDYCKAFFSNLNNVEQNDSFSNMTNAKHSSAVDEDYNEYYHSIMTGEEMARKFGKAPKELTRNMSAVITEFEKKSGIECTIETRRSRSRSRSRRKEKEHQNRENTYYNAYVTEETREYYDVDKINRFEKLLESQTMKKETVEKLFEEKVTRNEVPPINYIAIVEAYAYTNIDALLKELLKKEKAILLDEMQQSNRESKSIKVTDKSLSIDIKKEFINTMPNQSSITIEEIESIAPPIEQNISANIEKGLIGIAVQKTMQPLEPVLEIQEQNTIPLRQAYPTIHPYNVSVPGCHVTSVIDEKEDNFILSEVTTKQSIPQIDSLFKGVAEIIEVPLIEPVTEELEITDKTYRKLITSITKPTKSIASVRFDQPKMVFEASQKSLTEKTEINKHFEYEKAKEETAFISAEKLEKSVADSYIPVTEEASTKLDKMMYETMSSHSVIESSFQVVAIAEEIRTEEVCHEIDTKLRVINEKPHISIETPPGVVQKTITLINEPRPNEFQIPSPKPKTPIVSIEDTVKTVAEIDIPTIEEPIQDFEILEISNLHAKPLIDTFDITLVTTTQLLESKSDFDVDEIKTSQSRQTLEDVLKVPETITTLIEEPKDELLVVPTINEQHANLDVSCITAKAISEISLVEPECDSFEVLEVKRRQPSSVIEEIKMTAAEVVLNATLGPHEEAFVTPKMKELEANLKIKKLQAVEASIVYLDEKTQKDLKVENIDVIPKTVRIDVENNYLKTANLNKIDIKQSTHEIVEIVDDIREHVDVETEYKVEFPIEEEEERRYQNEIIELTAKKQKQKLSSSPVIDVYMFNVPFEQQIQYQKESVDAEELHLNIKNKHDYEITDVSVAESIGIILETEKDVEYVDEIEINEQIVLNYEKDSRNQQSRIIGSSIQQGAIVETLRRSDGLELDINIQSESNVDNQNKFYQSDESSLVKKNTQDIKQLEYDSKSIQRDIKVIETNIELSDNELSRMQAKNSKFNILVSKQSEIADLESHSAGYSETDASLSRTSKIRNIEVQKEIKSELNTSLTGKQSNVSKINVGSASTTKLDTTLSDKHSKMDIKEANVTELDISLSNKAASLSKIDRSILKQSNTTASTNDTSHINKQITEGSGRMLSDSPSHIPATPLIEEYMFRLVTQLPSREGTPVPRDCTPERPDDEQKLVAHMDVEIEQTIFDPPLPTPTPQEDTKRVYTKPGLKGGADEKEQNVSLQIEAAPKDKPNATKHHPNMDITEYKSETSIMTKTEKNIEKVDNDMKSQDTFRSEEKDFVKEERRREGNKMDVLIEKMVETSRRLSDEAPVVTEVDDVAKNEIIIPVSMDFKTKDIKAMLVTQQGALDGSNQLPDLARIGRNAATQQLEEVLMTTVQSMIDPQASIDSRISQIEEQISALSQLPDVIHRKLEDMRIQFTQLTKEKAFQLVQSQEIEKQDVSAPLEIVVPVETVQPVQPVVDIVEPPSTYPINANDFEIEELQRTDRFENTLFDEEQEYLMREKLSQELRIAKERLSPNPEQMQPFINPKDQMLPFITPQEQSPQLHTQEEQIPPFITQQEQIPPVMSQQEQIPPFIAQQEQIPPFIAQQEQIPPFISQQEQIPPFIAQQEQIPPFITPQEQIPPFITPQEQIPPFIAQQEQIPPVINWKEQIKPGIGQKEQSHPVVNQKEPVVTVSDWRKADDASLEQMLSETLAGQSEVIQGKAMGVNFKKYEKPPPALDHLQNSEVYKAVHNMDQAPLKKVEMLKPAIAASDYMQRVRSVSPVPKQFTEDCEL